ncbi:predicted protein [Nematostella vectensis]|uniref:Uncharacterized protein n=1 Tax=Nematostella vectensis TaxID=45351 RepID=A7T4H5_NEMVE|nr:predicted protein [Nematostella vectensis]|eukprot:XP_001621238.1 hypothetical protein NEMVEDRAFT_v1g222213 [Nematostella vectensis]
MAMKTLVWTCFLLNFLPYSTGKAVRDLSPDEFQNLAKSTSKNFVAVYFDHKDARQKYPSFFKEYRKACDHLDAYGIQLARIDCDSASIPECQQLTVLTYRDGELEESVSLDTLFNVDSIMAHLLQILLKYEITYLYDKPSADQLITESKGSKDVLFAYVKGFGSKAHRAIVEAAFVYSNQLAFALTTDADVAKGIIPNATRPSPPRESYFLIYKNCTQPISIALNT